MPAQLYPDNNSIDGTTDPDPEPRQAYDVKCRKCGWQGFWETQVKVEPRLVACGPDDADIDYDFCCPICGSVVLEDIPKINI